MYTFTIVGHTLFTVGVINMQQFKDPLLRGRGNMELLLGKQHQILRVQVKILIFGWTA